MMSTNRKADMSMTTRDRYRGALIGLAVGDALGTTVEFQPPGTFAPLTTIVGGGPFGLKPGEWTDDTSMALCLAESLIECRGFDPKDQMEMYVRWWRQGHMSCTGECFDIGATTSSALRQFELKHEPYCGSANPRAAGNGSIMRLVPVPMFFAGSPEEAITRAGDSSRTTHGAQTCVDACRYMAGLIVGALSAVGKDEMLSDRYCPVPQYWMTHALVPEIDEVARGSFKRKEPPAIRGTGYVVQSLEAALWAFHKSTEFRDGALMAVNLGDDADTTGAVYGQIAGAFYGYEGIPEGWRSVVAQRDMILGLADRLADRAAL
jgi:ADP-ribosyl-[dinitrogen reductase] hydrolase